MKKEFDRQKQKALSRQEDLDRLKAGENPAVIQAENGFISWPDSIFELKDVHHDDI